MKKIFLICFLFTFFFFQNTYCQELVFKDGIVQEVDTLIYTEWNDLKDSLKIISKNSNYSQLNSLIYNKITLDKNLLNNREVTSSDEGIDDYDLINKFLISSAPKAASNFKSSVNISADLYTKTKNINIPIYTFGGKEIQVPISLNRRTPFIRKGMKESMVGFNWELVVGGEIIRSINGKADESINGYFESYDKIENAKDLSRSEFDRGMKNEWDTSPDKFSFNFNGISGTFMFDRYKNIHIDSQYDLKILTTYSSNNREILSFLVIDDNGFIYHFGGQENAIEEIASKTSTFLTRKIPEGLYTELSFPPVGVATYTVYNFIPNVSCWGCEVVGGGGATVNVGRGDIFGPNQYTYPGFSGNYSTNYFTQANDDLDEAPVNIGWKLTKIESPNKTDTVDFEYDTGGWTEYYNPREKVKYIYRKSDAGFIMLVKNPNYQPPPYSSLEPYLIYVHYQGKAYGARPAKWTMELVSSSPVFVFDNLDRTPHLINHYSTKVYKKTSSLTKIKNKYNEYIDFNYNSNTISGFESMSTGNYGTPYSPKYLNDISIFPTPSAYDNNILAVFNTSPSVEGGEEGVNLLSKLKVFDQHYSFESDMDEVNKITYPTGGSIEFSYRYINKKLVEIKEVLNSGNETDVIKKYLFKDLEYYNLPNIETKFFMGNGNSYVDVYNSSYNRVYSKGTNNISGKVYSYINEKLQNIYEFTTPDDKKDDKNYAYKRLTDTNPILNNWWKHKTRPSTRDFERGIEKLRVQYNPQSDVNKVLSENKEEHEVVTSIKAVKLVDFYIGFGNFTTEESRSYSHYYYYFPIKKSSNSTNVTFFDDGKLMKSTTDATFDTNYLFNNKVNQTIVTDSENNQIISRFKYPYSTVYPNSYYSPTLNADGEAYRLLNVKNMDNIQTEKTVYKKFNGSNEELLLSSTLQLFKHSFVNDYLHIYPSRVEIIEEDNLLNDYAPLNISSSGTNFYLNKDSRLKTKIDYEHFDSEGNLLQFRNKDDIPTSYIWGYQNRHIVAKIIGIEYQEIVNDMGQMFLTNLNNSTDDSNILSSVQNIRNTFDKGFVTTYTYTTVIPKIKSITNENGITTYYKYKNGRLASINDLNGHIIEEYRYNFRYENSMPIENIDCDSYSISIFGARDDDTYSYSYTACDGEDVSVNDYWGALGNSQSFSVCVKKGTGGVTTSGVAGSSYISTCN